MDAATGNERRPTVARVYAGTYSLNVVASQVNHRFITYIKLN